MKTDIANILLLTLIIFSCAENPNPTVGLERHELDGTRWWPVELHGEIVINRVYEKFPVLSFNRDSLEIAMSACGGGTSAARWITIQGDSILHGTKFGWPAASCRCVPTKECIDQQMVHLLNSARSYLISSDSLYIFFERSVKPISTFVRYGDNDYIATGCGG